MPLYICCMKTIGFIGGLTWLSSMDYYRLFNQLTNEQLGGASSCKLLMYSVNFEEIKTLTLAGNWPAMAEMMCSLAQKLENAGAECIVIGANTMHHIADTIAASVNIPLIHIAAVTGEAIGQQQLTKVALLGTRYTMQFDFYKAHLAALGIQTMVPDEAGMHYLNNAIYNEMGKGVFLPETKQGVLQIIETLRQQGAQAVILGCTELPILIKQQEVAIPLFDTTLLHAKAAVAFALK
ncbi:MAG: hypothetical protein RL172_829 [Bacteroidota bacterium]|jgi:aspartate racemase